MTFDAIRFLQDHNISHSTSGKNVGAGWVGVCCPFCNDTSDHGGFNLETGRYSCWRCGLHKLPEVIKQLTGLAMGEIRSIIRAYEEPTSPHKRVRRPVGQVPFVLPGDIMSRRHRQYLKGRHFDPDMLERKYNLRGTGTIGPDKFRIIAPIYFNGQVVSYQGRDITDWSPLRYKACRMEMEIVHHKHILYNLDTVPGDEAVIVEGITDVWRLGDGSVATFGTEVTERQVKLVANRFKKAYVFFDNAPEAREKADDFIYRLEGRGCRTERIRERGDPASLSTREAEGIMRELLNVENRT